MKYYFAILFYYNGKPYTIETFEVSRTEEEAIQFAEEYMNVSGCESFELFYGTSGGTYGRL